MEKRITHVQNNSPAARCGLRPGWIAKALNGREEFDILDYMNAEADGSFSLTVVREDGAKETILLKNPEYEPVGLSFETLTIDKPRFCRNNCVFCFMNQLPGGMRDTLFFKDDDYRLSFTCGNYVTLTNASEKDIQRIIDYKLDPMNISVHTTNPKLREKMLRNPKAGQILSQLKKLREGGVSYNVQLVLCPGYNDGEELRRTLEDMLVLIPAVNSLSCVPVGLTKYRENLPQLTSFDKEGAQEVIDIIDEYRAKAQALCGESLFHASDEFYLLAQRPFPPEEYYGDYAQYENGVGMARSLLEELEWEIGQGDGDTFQRGLRATLVTGVLGEKVLREPIRRMNEAFPGLYLTLALIQNDFFGRSVTASGLVCGGTSSPSLKVGPMKK